MEVGVNKINLFHLFEVPKHGRGKSWFSVLYTAEKEEKKKIWQSIKKLHFITDCQMPGIFREDFTSWFTEEL